MLNLSNNNNKSQIKIRLKKGSWEIEVECPEDKIDEVIPKLLASLPMGSAQDDRAAISRGITCKTLLEQLWKEGWFLQDRTLYDVDEELGRRGYHYDKSAVSHSLTDLTREGVLTRVGMPRSYRYLQKKPPTP